MFMPHVFQRTVRIALALSACVVLLLVAAFAVLTTEAGGRWLSVQIERAASSPDDFSLRLRGLRLAFPLHVQIDALEIYQRERRILSAQAITAVLNPLAAIRGRPSLSDLAVERMTIENRPASDGKSGSETSRLPSFGIERLRIGVLAFSPAIIGAPFSVSIDGRVSWSDAAKDLTLKANRLDGSGALIEADAHIAEEVRGRLLVDDREGVLLRLMNIGAAAAPFSASFDMEGTLQNWSGRFEARLGDAAAKGDIRGVARDKRRQQLTLHAEAETAELLPPSLTERFGRNFALMMQGTLDDTQFVMEQLSLQPQAIPSLAFTAQANILFSPFEARGDLQIRADPFPAALAVGIERAAVSLSRVTWRNGRLQTDAQLAAQAQLTADPSPVTLAAAVRTAPNGPWLLDDLVIEHEIATLNGETTYQPEDSAVSLNLRAARVDAGKLTAMAGVSVGGEISAAIEGVYRAGMLDGRAEATIGRLGPNAQPIDALRLTVEGRDVLGNGAIDLGGTASFRGRPVTLTAKAQKAAEEWNVPTLMANVAGATLNGRLIYNRNGRVRGDLAFDIPDIAPLAGVFSLEMSGTAKAQVILKDIGRTQALDAQAEVLNFSYGDNLRIAETSLSASLREGLRRPRGTALATAQNVAIGAEELRMLRLDAKFDGDATTLSLSARAPESKRLDLDAEATLRRAADETVLSVTRLTGAVQEQALFLQQAARLTLKTDGWTVDMPSLRVGSGTAAATVDLRNQRIEGRLSLQQLRLPLAMLSEDLPRFATLDGRLTLRGTIVAPEGDANVTIETTQAGNDVLRAAIDATLRDRTLQIDARTGTEGAFVAVKGTAQLADGLRSSSFASAQSSLALSIAGKGELARLDAFLPIGEDRLEGGFDIAGSIGGSFADPQFDGRFTLDGGRYENAVLGAVFGDLRIRISGDSSGLRLERIEARDGGDGSFSAEGRWPFGGEQRQSATIRFERFRLLRRDDISATVTGSLALGRIDDGPILSGNLAIDNADVNLAEAPTARIEAIDVVEIPSRGAPAAENDPAASAASPLRLELTMRSRRPIFVRGRGLESEWNGEIAVTGTVNEPRLQGRFTVERGEYRLLGQRLPLTSGTVTMTGGRADEARIDVTSSTVRADTTLEVKLSGTMLAPVITFSSTPPLPSEEILSRLLFGQTRASLGPLQAIQLADAARSVAGLGGSASLTERLRDVFGLASFDVGTDDEGNTEVRAGSYIRRGVYLGVQRNTGSGVGSATLEVDVTKNVTIDTTVGTSDERELGVNWRRDY